MSLSMQHCSACGGVLPLAFLDVTLDTQALIATDGVTKSSKLTMQEFRFLELLVAAKGRTVSNDYLYDALYGRNPDKLPGANMVSIWVFKLRRKLKPLRLGIQLSWGMGYALCKLEDADAQH